MCSRTLLNTDFGIHSLSLHAQTGEDSALLSASHISPKVRNERRKKKKFSSDVVLGVGWTEGLDSVTQSAALGTTFIYMYQI